MLFLIDSSLRSLPSTSYLGHKLRTGRAKGCALGYIMFGHLEPRAALRLPWATFFRPIGAGAEARRVDVNNPGQRPGLNRTKTEKSGTFTSSIE